MRAISLHQPCASLCVTRQPCPDARCHQGVIVDSSAPWGAEPTEPEPIGPCQWCTEGPMVKRFETRSWPCPPNLIGSRIALHATQRQPDHLAHIGDWTTHTSYYTDGLPQMRRLGSVVNGELVPDGHERGLIVDLPLGVVVGSAVIEACYPIVHWSDNDEESPSCISVGHDTGRIYANIGWGHNDISDQLPYGDYRPGRYAWLLGDAKPVQERCPWCWGTGNVDQYASKPWPTWDHVHDPCPVCNVAGRCEPIPARGRQRIWNWDPT